MKILDKYNLDKYPLIIYKDQTLISRQEGIQSFLKTKLTFLPPFHLTSVKITERDLQYFIDRDKHYLLISSFENEVQQTLIAKYHHILNLIENYFNEILDDDRELFRGWEELLKEVFNPSNNQIYSDGTDIAIIWGCEFGSSSLGTSNFESTGSIENGRKSEDILYYEPQNNDKSKGAPQEIAILKSELILVRSNKVSKPLFLNRILKGVLHFSKKAWWMILLFALLFHLLNNIFCVSCSQYDSVVLIIDQYPRGIDDWNDVGYDSIPVKPALLDYCTKIDSSQVSLRSYAPFPGNQSNFGTCTGWASAYCARTIMRAQSMKWTNRSDITKNSFSGGFQYRAITSDYNCSQGSDLVSVAHSLRDIGSLQRIDLDDEEELCPSVNLAQHYFTNASNHRIDDYAKLWLDRDVPSAAKIAITKKSLSDGYPIIIGMQCPESFNNIGKDGLWRPSESVEEYSSGHAMCVIGYDDQRFGGTFEVQNSWGIDWGDEGYCYIKYNDFASYVRQAIELIKIENTLASEVGLSGGFEIINMEDNNKVRLNLDSKLVNGSMNTYYQFDQKINSGTNVKLNLTNNVPAFVYVLKTNCNDKSVSKISPYPGQSAALTYHCNEISILSDGDYYKSGDNCNDNFILLFSKKRLDIDAIVSELNINKNRADISSNLGAALKHKTLPKSQINLSADECSFSAKGVNLNQYIVPIIIESKNSFNPLKSFHRW